MDNKDIEPARMESIGSEKHPNDDVENLKSVGIDENKNVGTLERRLKSRHIQFLALSGAIGTGLFVGSGQVLSLAGPLSMVLAYLITGFNLYCVINSLGEMTTYLPIPGAVPVFAARYVDEALGFVLGWNYYYQLAIGVPIARRDHRLRFDHRLLAKQRQQCCLDHRVVHPQIILNCLPVHYYGEAEFVFGAIKLTTILGLIILMFIITLGGGPRGDRIGFRYWDSPGPMNTYLEPGALGRFLAFFKVFIQATFSYGGAETCVIAAGETENPRKNIPKAVRRVFWRILVFYCLGLFMVTLCVSSEDPLLLRAIQSGKPGVTASPFVIAIKRAGINALPDIINAVVLTSAWSAGNSFYYTSTRVLYAAALDGKAPKILTYEKFGVPYACVGLTTAIGCLAYLNVSNSSAEVFFWFSNISAVSTLLVWCSVCITYLRFFYGLKANGIARSSLPWKSPFQPFLAYFAVCFCSIIAFFNGFDCFFPGNFSAKTFVPPYIDIPIFLGLYFGYKLVKKTKIVKLKEMDLWSGKDAIDRQEHLWPERKARNWLERIWFWIA